MTYVFTRQLNLAYGQNESDMDRDTLRTLLASAAADAAQPIAMPPRWPLPARLIVVSALIAHSARAVRVHPLHSSSVNRLRVTGSARCCIPAEGGISAKDALLSQLLDGLSISTAARLELGETLIALEKENPTTKPAYSRLLNGVWELQFAGAPGPGLLDSPTREIALALYATGYSPGALLQFLGKLPSPVADALKLESASITITAQEAGQPRATSDVSLSLFGTAMQLKLRSNMQPVSSVRLREELVEAEVRSRLNVPTLFPIASSLHPRLPVCLPVSIE